MQNSLAKEALNQKKILCGPLKKAEKVNCEEFCLKHGNPTGGRKHQGKRGEEFMEMWSRKTMKRISWKDRVTNEEGLS